MKQLVLFASVALATFSSCGKKEEAQPVPAQSVTIRDLPADPPTGSDQKGNFTGQTGKPYLLDIKTGKQVPNEEENTDKWHVGFRIGSRKINITVNGGISGPGGCSAQIVNGVFDSYKNAPAEGYLQDSDASLAIPNAMPSSWVEYNRTTHTLTPKAGTIIVLKTGEGRYAKIEIISFYKGAPGSPTLQNQLGYFTLRYVYQPNNSTAF